MKQPRSDGIDPAARSRARRRALQAVYAWQLSNSPVERVIEQFRDEQDMEVADLEYFEALVRGVVQHAEELDAVLARYIDRGMRSKETTRPPSLGTLAPVVLVPRPRATTGTRCCRQARTIACTCPRFVGSATASGCACLRELS